MLNDYIIRISISKNITFLIVVSHLLTFFIFLFANICVVSLVKLKKLKIMYIISTAQDNLINKIIFLNVKNLKVCIHIIFNAIIYLS